MQSTNVQQNLAHLREHMSRHSIDAYIVPSSDPHNSEYVADRFKGRAFLTGFTGSAGLVVITSTHCLLWTDGRYFIQAAKALEGTEIQLQKIGEPSVPTYIAWLDDYLKAGMTLGYDALVVSVHVQEALKSGIQQAICYETSYDLLDQIWPERPKYPCSHAFVHPIAYTGASITDKLSQVRSALAKTGADFYLISSLSDVAWLFNIRGHDIAHTPVIYAYGLISQSDALLYVSGNSIGPDVAKALNAHRITFRHYDKISHDLAQVSEDQSVYFDSATTNVRLFEAMENCKQHPGDSLIAPIKSVFNTTEIRHLRNCQIKDGVAMTNCLHLIDTTLDQKPLTENDIALTIHRFRAEQADFIEPSFATISAYGPNAAMMHYETDPDQSPLIEPRSFLLLDSGGQYLDGTTDITRTIVLGDLTASEKTDFTLVLKGHIQLSLCIFLKGTSGNDMDILARRPLWQAQKDYKSGTGHGVGYLLGVHEGLQRIAKKAPSVPLEIGMVVTNEPGIYLEGLYGIRTENMLLVVPHSENEHGTFYQFETISYCPIDRRAIDITLLNHEEIDWLNTYHQTTYDQLSPHLSEPVAAWLKKMTQPL